MNSPSNLRHRLKVGETYLFHVRNSVQIGDDEQLILEYEGVKFMLDAASYKHYPIKKGDVIPCKIDKINCAGKMFIEPEHPYLKPGEKYTLRIEGKQSYQNALGEHIECIQVLDHKNAVHWIPNFTINDEMTGQNISLELNYVRKGKAVFLPHKAFKYTANNKKGKKYTFSVIGKQKIDDKTFLLVNDSKGEKHGIDLKLYNAYKLEEKKTIAARVIKFSSSYQFVLEPDHPMYNIGKRYAFRYQMLESNDKHVELEVTDCFRQKILVILATDYFNKHATEKDISLKIKDIIKSVPEFEVH